MKKYFLTFFILFLSWGNLFAYLSTEEGVLVSTPEITKTKSQVSSEEASEEVDIEKEGKAIVDEIEGKALLTKSGNPQEKKIKVGDWVGAGDSVYTEKGASLTMSFDNEKLNTIKIPAESKVVFVSIKPVEMKLENGSIFNSVDGLAEGGTWKVSTPAATAAVRGTQFEVEYSETSGEFSTATFEDTNEKKASAVEIQSPSGGPAVQIKEGREMAFKRGQPFSHQSVKAMSPERAQRGQKMMRAEGERRKQFVERKKERELKKGPNGPNGPGSDLSGDRRNGGPNSRPNQLLDQPMNPEDYPSQISAQSKPLETGNAPPSLVQNHERLLRPNEEHLPPSAKPDMAKRQMNGVPINRAPPKVERAHQAVPSQASAKAAASKPARPAKK